jgi:predicted DNA-binding transcriptional regulator YafY
MTLRGMADEMGVSVKTIGRNLDTFRLIGVTLHERERWQRITHLSTGAADRAPLYAVSDARQPMRRKTSLTLRACEDVADAALNRSASEVRDRRVALVALSTSVQRRCPAPNVRARRS